MGLHQRSAGLLLDSCYVLGGLVARDLEKELSGQGVTVGVQAGGGQPDEHVAGLDADAGDDLVAVNCADNEAGQIVFAIGVEAGHLGGFPADEGAAVSLAGVRQAGYDAFGHFGVKLSAGQVIEEKQRGCALHGDVVYAVVDEVSADGAVQAEFEGYLELGSDAVSGADQDGVFPALGVEPVECSEAADAT